MNANNSNHSNSNGKKRVVYKYTLVRLAHGNDIVESSDKRKNEGNYYEICCTYVRQLNGIIREDVMSGFFLHAILGLTSSPPKYGKIVKVYTKEFDLSIGEACDEIKKKFEEAMLEAYPEKDFPDGFEFTVNII